MTSADGAVKEFMCKPFELYFMRGKQFTIIENLPRNKDLREVEEINKWNKKESVMFMRIEQGLFQKDLKMTKGEFMEFSLSIPKGIDNLQGLMFEVDQHNSKIVKYVGTAAQDINGNKLSANTSPMEQNTVYQTQQPQDQRDIFLTKLVNSIRVLDELGNKVDAAYVMKICENISPGKALDLFQYAKTKGTIREENGAYKVN